MKKVYLFILFVLFSTQITLAQSYQFTKVADLQYAMGVVFNSDNEMYYFSQSAGLFDETGTNLLTDAQTGHSFGCIGVENETIWTGGYWGVTEYNAGSYTSYTSIPGVSNPAFYDIDYHQNNVYAAIEDDGLGYFNGIEWKVYTSSDGLTASWFTSVTHDDSGKIYIAGVNGSWDEGIIDMFDGSIWSSFTIADHGLDMILNVFVDSQGNLWTAGSGISMYDGNKWSVILSPGAHSFYSINEDLHGNMWFGEMGNTNIQMYDGIQLNSITLPQKFWGRTNGIGINQNGELFVSLEDGVYKVEELNGNSIISYSFAEQNAPAVIDQDNCMVNMEVVNGTNLTNLAADFSISLGATAFVGVTQQVSGVTSNDFSAPVSYAVESGTGTTQYWTIRVSVAPLLNYENDILSFNIPGQVWAATLDDVNHTVWLKVPDGTNLTNLVADFSLSDGAEVYVGVTLQESGVTANDFTNPVTYIVEAEDGTTQNWIITLATTGIDDLSIPTTTVLEQNYPNPFNPSTEISFSLVNKSHAKLTVLNSKGEIVETLNNSKLDKGYHSFIFDAKDLNSGVYFYQLDVNGIKSTKKMVLMK